MSTPKEAHDQVGSAERSHAYLRIVYEKLCMDIIMLYVHSEMPRGIRCTNLKIEGVYRNLEMVIIGCYATC